MSHQTAQVSRGRGMSRSTGGSNKTGYGKSTGAQRQERARLIQLTVCLILFLTVLVGKGVFPTQVAQVRNQILTLLSANIDFEAAFSNLGESLSGEGGVFRELGDFCAEVFGPSEQAGSGEEEDAPVPRLTSILTQESRFLSENPDTTALAKHFLRDGQQAELWPTQAQDDPPSQAQEAEPSAAVPAAGTVVLKSDYSGQALPENYTMDQLSLGTLETMTPVLGHINSEYGYREHPVNGVYQFHGGVDIGAQMRDPIFAFAAGTVEYVGEDDSYGLYFQLDHGNGVKSFYAHCSAVCVSKGETVSLGQKVAEVGASGMATGPHLHLELKYDRTHLNPIYYIDYLTNQ